MTKLCQQKILTRKKDKGYLTPFCINMNFIVLINTNPTCYKKPNSTNNIDPILTNCSKSFQNFHKLILSVFKTTFTKSKPKEIVYRKYRKFNENNFNEDRHNQLSSEQSKDHTSFEKIFLSISEEHARIKKKLLRANHAPYVTNAFRKAIMRRSYTTFILRK